MSLFEELKRRNVFKVGIAYVVTAWLIMQVSDVVLSNVGAPSSVFQVIMFFLAIGFPLILLFAWAFELTPKGLKHERQVDRAQSIASQTGRKLDFLIIGVLVVALGYFLWERQALLKADDSSKSPVAVETDAMPTSDSKKRSLAVLPFVNLSSDKDQEWFADGLTEELLNSLARTADLLVTARTSSFKYKGSNEDIPTIARALGVEHVLEGSVRRSGDRLRVTAQLIRASEF